MARINQRTGEVELLDENGALMWAGKPLGCDARAVLPIDGTNDVVVLLNPDSGGNGPFRNLLRLAQSGAIVWQADLPTRDRADAYMKVRWQGNRLVANSWSTYLVELDEEDGRIVNKTFTK